MARSIAGCAMFLILIQSRERPERLAAVAPLGDDALETHVAGRAVDDRTVDVDEMLTQPDALVGADQELRQLGALPVAFLLRFTLGFVGVE